MDILYFIENATVSWCAMPVLHAVLCWFSEMHLFYKKKTAVNSTLTTCYIKLSELLTQHCTVEGFIQRFPKVNIYKMHEREMLLPKQIKS